MRRIAVLFMLMISAGLAHAQPEMTVEANSRQVGLGETAQITVTVLDQKADVSAPAVSGYQLNYQGQGTSHNFSFVNGQMSQQTSYTYTFTFRSDNLGSYEVGPFTVKVGGATYSTGTVSIEVVEQSRRQSQQSGSYDFWDEFFYGEEESDPVPTVFMEIYANKENIVKNEQMVVEVILNASDQGVLESEIVEHSELLSDKMIIYDVTEHADTESILTQWVNGKQYYYKTHKKYVLYPIESGMVAMAPPSFVAVTEWGHLNFSYDNIGVKVGQLGATSGLSYVGELEIDRQIETNVVREGKSIEMTLEMRGTGNLKILSNPLGNVDVEGLFISAPQSELEVLRVEDSDVWFTQTLSYSILAQDEGDYSFPELEINYYTDDQRSRSLSLDSFDLTVLPTERRLADSEDFELRLLDKLNSYRFRMLGPEMLIALALFVILPFIGLFIGRHRQRMMEDEDYARQFLAGKKLNRYMESAKGHLRSANWKEFYLDLQKGLFYYAIDKYSLKSGITIKQLLEKLKESGMVEGTIAELEEVYKLCGYYGYSGAPGGEKRDELLKRSLDLIKAI